MLYVVAVKDKVSGRNFKVSADADNYPNAVIKAMRTVHERLRNEGEPFTHLIQHPDYKAPRV